MVNTDDIVKNVDIQKIAEDGGRIYESIKASYEPAHKGNFLAIETAGGNVFLASTSSEAVAAARAAHPGKVFYVVKVGFSAAETLANLGRGGL